MSNHLRVAFAVTILISTAVSAAVAGSPATMMTFDDVDGSRYFAMSLQASDTLPAADSRDILILMDTSASQAGVYRDDALEAVETVVRSLSPSDRVKIAAVDLKSVPLSDGFAAAESNSTRQALDKLRQRAPLGSTDLVSGLTTASSWFDRDASVPRHIVYIGDGVSHADLPNPKQFSQLVDRIADDRITVTSYAIGPHRNIHTLAAVANQTGGQVLIDAENLSGQQAGQMLAKSFDSPIIWPTQGNLGATVKETYPNRLPPLRQDRDSILIGTLKGEANPAEVTMVAEVNGQPIELSWNVAVKPSSNDYAFLNQLVASARADGGASLPTLGTDALREIRRMTVANSDQLTEVGGQALAAGNVAGAALLANEALKRDPSNPQAATLQRAVQKKGETLLVQEPEEELRLVPESSPAPAAGGNDDLLQGFERREAPSGLLDRAVEERRLNTEIIKSDVTQGLADSRRIVRTNPNEAIIGLKTLRESVYQAPDLDAEVRSQLLDRIETSLRQANQQKLEKDQRDQTLRANLAQARERQRLLDMSRRDDVLIETYIDQFNTNLDEKRWDLAVQAAQNAYDTNPDLVATDAALVKGHMKTAYERQRQLVAIKEQAFLDTLYQTELSHIPFPGDPPIAYPDPEVWQDITNRRQKYAEIDYAKTGRAEKKILEELERETKVDFIEDPISDVLTYLEQYHGIQIELDVPALDALGVDSNSPITKQLSGIKLKSALNLILQDLGLTYVIEDEVLQITSPDEAETRLVTKVYPVADLVLPIQSMGGMGMGGMGMGGFFDVEDNLTLGTAKTQGTFQPKIEKPATAAPRKVKGIQVQVAERETQADAWLKFFQAQPETIDDAAVRATLRDRMTNRQFGDVVVILQSALRAGYVRPWMYEALGLAMKANGSPDDEIERALTSAIDLSNDASSALMAAAYLARLGHQPRALKILQEVGESNPLRPESYIQAMTLAKSLNDVDGMCWAVTNILRQAWPREHRDIQEKAIKLARATLSDLESTNKAQAKIFREALSGAIVRDCMATVSWTGDADIDVLVEEPSGAVCSVHHQRTPSGGVLLGDAFANSAENTGTTSESYVCPEGFSGQYRMLVRRIWGDVTAGKVTVDVYINRNTPNEKHIRRQIPLTDKDAIIIFEVPEGRRQESLAAHQIASVTANQAVINRGILAQQLNSVSQSDAVAELAIARARRDGVFPGFFRNPAVGYQPQITTLPEGINMMMATAVISADRRYVRFSPGMIMFSLIGDVQTFNFATGQGGNGNAGLPGGGGMGGGMGGMGMGGGF